MAFSSPRETVRALLLAEAVAGLAIEWGFAAPAQVAMELTKRAEHGDFATNADAIGARWVGAAPPADLEPVKTFAIDRALTMIKATLTAFDVWVDAIAQVTRNALRLLGVSAPEQMTRLEENITKEDD